MSPSLLYPCYTLHSTLYTLHSTLYTLHQRCPKPGKQGTNKSEQILANLDETEQIRQNRAKTGKKRGIFRQKRGIKRVKLSETGQKTVKNGQKTGERN